jgi:hypothetical protein
VPAQTAATLHGADEDNATVLAAVAGGTAPAAAPSAAALPVPSARPDLALPEVPAMTPPPVLPGDQLSTLIHGGAGSSGLRDFAGAWRAHADTLDDVADQVLVRGAAIDEHWIDGNQRAGANTREHGYWLRASGDRARTIAAGASQVAGEFDSAKNAIPSPEEFDAPRRELFAAQARRDPIGMTMAARKYADLQAQAVAAMAYHGGGTSAVNTLGTPLQTAPAIARGGSGVQAVDFHTPAPEGRGGPADPPDPPPGGLSKDPLMRAAQKIAYGHAEEFHLQQGEFGSMTKDQLAQLVYDKMKRAIEDPTGLKLGPSCTDGAPVIYDPSDNVMIVRDPGSKNAELSSR